jgi:hypothetical protein
LASYSGLHQSLRGQTPTDLHMGASVPTTNFVGLPVTLTETQRKAAINSPMQSSRFPVNLKGGLRRNRNASSCLELLLILTAQFFAPLNNWWLNRQQHAAIPAPFDMLVAEPRQLLCYLISKITPLTLCSA